MLSPPVPSVGVAFLLGDIDTVGSTSVLVLNTPYGPDVVLAVLVLTYVPGEDRDFIVIRRVV